MLEEELKRMLVRGTRGGCKTMKKSKGKGRGVAKSGYIAHVKKYHRAHPSLTWKEAMVKARSSYTPKKRKAGTRAGTMAGSKGNFRKKASKINTTLRNKKAISKTLRALSAIPTPLSGYATDASLIAEALGYGRQPVRRLRRY